MKLTPSGYSPIPSSKIKVGDLIVVEKDDRVPADMVLIRTTEKTGTCFIRTDQLDGETDWKLRLAVPHTQKLEHDTDAFHIDASVFAEKPQRDIHTFIGTFKRVRKFSFFVHEHFLFFFFFKSRLMGNLWRIL